MLEERHALQQQVREAVRPRLRPRLRLRRWRWRWRWRWQWRWHRSATLTLTNQVREAVAQERSRRVVVLRSVEVEALSARRQQRRL